MTTKRTTNQASKQPSKQPAKPASGLMPGLVNKNEANQKDKPPPPPPLQPHELRESAQRVRGSLSRMLSSYPFFGSLALRMPLAPTEKIKTIASDGEKLYYNPRWVYEEADGDHIRAAIARSTLACALKHHTRRGNRSYARWQHASKVCTRPFLDEAGLLPKELMDKTNDFAAGMDLSIERIYDLLPEGEEGDGDGEGEGQAENLFGEGRGQGQGEGEAEGDGQGDGQDQQGQGKGKGKGRGQGQQGGPGQNDGSDGSSGNSPQQKQQNQDNSDGSGSGQDQQQPEQKEDNPQAGHGQEQYRPPPPSYDPTGEGEVMDSPTKPKPSEPDDARQLEEQNWDQALHSAVLYAKSQGHTAGRGVELVAKMHRNPVDWATVLRRFMTSSAQRDYSWSRPNRRHIDSGLYLPALHSEAMPPIIFAIDTSGSMSSDELAMIWNEIQHVAGEIRPEAIHVIQCDTRISGADEYQPFDLPDTLEAKGRGGTAFSPVFEYVEENVMRTPACLIYCTDLGANDFPDPAPAYPVMWAVTGNFRYGFEPPFGQRLDLNPQEE